MATEPTQRRLAAILSADAVGYSQLRRRLGGGSNVSDLETRLGEGRP
jgi:hypothetical protein